MPTSSLQAGALSSAAVAATRAVHRRPSDIDADLDVEVMGMEVTDQQASLAISEAIFNTYFARPRGARRPTAEISKECITLL
jgi:predicted TPR repeat methyltransferase